MSQAQLRMPSPRFQSSGDLIADRRFEWARDREGKGDLRGAVDLIGQTLEIAPGYASAWFVLGGLQEKLGDRAAAIHAYHKACDADPHDILGAALNLMRLGAEVTEEMPAAYVRHLYDHYASTFEESLERRLGYCGPALLRALVEKVCDERGRRATFDAMLDLGCGTGLAGAAFRPIVKQLTGVDLSSRMIALAARKDIYDRLFESDMSRFLASETESGVQYDLAVAADVFIYIADLAPVMAAIARSLAPRGLFVFTVETHDGAGAILGQKLRYAHGEQHVRLALTAGGFEVCCLEYAPIRTENGIPAPGLIVAAVPASTVPRSGS